MRLLNAERIVHDILRLVDAQDQASTRAGNGTAASSPAASRSTR